MEYNKLIKLNKTKSNFPALTKTEIGRKICSIANIYMVYSIHKVENLSCYTPIKFYC